MELRPFGTLRLEVPGDGLFMLGQIPAGNRIIQEIGGVRFEGERLKGSLKGKAAADWLLVDSTGTAHFDIRLLMETDDGALVFLAYDGKADWSGGLGQGPIYVRATFESGDERYQWVNTIPVIGKGVVENGQVAYHFYEMV